MNSPLITSTSPDAFDDSPPLDDDFLSTFDDAVLEHALKTVNWHPKDVSQFLWSNLPR
jgi:hypothetical protein